MKANRWAALVLVAAASSWIGSGYLFPHEDGAGHAAVKEAPAPKQKLFRVAVAPAQITERVRRFTLSGRTEADRKVMAIARGGGVVTELKVRRGSRVQQGEVIAVLSDEAREAQVAQARALYTQKKTELEVKSRLIANGTMPKLEQVNLEAQYKAAEAALAGAEAERDRGVVRAPWSGIVAEVPVEVGQAAFSMAGREIAQIVALDPMLAVVEVAERRLGGVRVGGEAEIKLVTGETHRGRIRYVAKTAMPTTRTYRVDIEIPNTDGAIPDGITVEVSLPSAPAPAAKVLRSALTFSSSGDLGVRIVEQGRVAFVPVRLVQDEQQHVWVAGLSDGAQVIVQGQDFVREDQQVETVVASEQTASN